MTAGSYHPGDPMWISKLKKGGIAYRTGMLHSGDVLLAINGVGLENCTLGEAARMLKNTGDTVSLRVSKENGKYLTMFIEVRASVGRLRFSYSGTCKCQALELGQPLLSVKYPRHYRGFCYRESM